MTLIAGDCLEAMRAMEPDSVDAVITDPPYGISFMGKHWDTFDIEERVGKRDVSKLGVRLTGGADSPNRKETARFQRWTEGWASEAFRVLKPGGHLLSFCGTRTYHRMAAGIEDAGFEIRDCLAWMYASGFPKSLNPYRSIMGGLCRSLESAPHAALISPWLLASSSAGSAPTVHALARIQPEDELVLLTATGGAARSLAPMATSLSGWVATTRSSTDSSWNAPLDDLCEATSTSTTSTETSRTTGSRTWSFSLWRITPVSTLLNGSRPSGCECAAFTATSSSIDDASGPKLILVPTALAPATAQPFAPLKSLGSALKPAFELIVLARKPLIGTVAANVLAHGTGALNVDGCRIATGGEPAYAYPNGAGGSRFKFDETPNRLDAVEGNTLGRWPANVILDEDAAAALDAQTGQLTSGDNAVRTKTGSFLEHGGLGKAGDVQTTYGDTGGASRFFYCAKVSAAERNAGLAGFEPTRIDAHGHTDGRQWDIPGSHTNREGATRRNIHPTVKPIALMRWLVRLVTPPGGTVLDPFLGSGTTGCAAVLEGFEFIGCEREADYLAIADARIAFWAEHGEEGLRIVRETERAEAEREAIRQTGQADIFELLATDGDAA